MHGSMIATQREDHAEWIPGVGETNGGLDGDG